MSGDGEGSEVRSGCCESAADSAGSESGGVTNVMSAIVYQKMNSRPLRREGGSVRRNAGIVQKAAGSLEHKHRVHRYRDMKNDCEIHLLVIPLR